VSGTVRASLSQVIVRELLTYLQAGSFENSPPGLWRLAHRRRTDKKWWAILVFALKDAPRILADFGLIIRDTNLWLVMLYYIYYFIEMASRLWAEIEKSFKRLLARCLTEKLLAKDNKFS
jgi:hypothetical protein